MRIARLEPMLWIHIAAIAPILISIEATWLALAASQPVWYGLEYALLAAVSILPSLLMQLVRPFGMFSIGLVALRPERLSQSQRQILSLLKKPKFKLIASITAVLMLVLLRQLYVYAPLAAPVTPIVNGRIWGLLLAAIAYSITNLLVQVWSSAIAIALTPDTQLASTPSVEESQVSQQFMLPGIKLNQMPLVPNSEPFNPTRP